MFTKMNKLIFSPTTDSISNDLFICSKINLQSKLKKKFPKVGFVFLSSKFSRLCQTNPCNFLFVSCPYLSRTFQWKNLELQCSSSQPQLTTHVVPCVHIKSHILLVYTSAQIQLLKLCQSFIEIRWGCENILVE